jgi:hypothetical protein
MEVKNEDESIDEDYFSGGVLTRLSKIMDVPEFVDLKISYDVCL